MNIRKFVVRATHLDDMVGLGTLTTQCARFLEAAMSAGLNILVAGGTQAGNATNRQYTRWGCRANLRRARSELGMRSSSRARFMARR